MCRISSKVQHAPSTTIPGNSLAAGDQNSGRHQPSPSHFRFWHDEKRFKGSGETSLAQRALLALGGKRIGGNIKSDVSIGPMGWQRMEEWDLLWSPASTAHKALEMGLRPGQLCNAMPGTQSICRKKELAKTLCRAYGDYAFEIVPRTYALPSQISQWQSWMKESVGNMEGRLWMLKTPQHLGKGLKLVHRSRAVKEVIAQYGGSRYYIECTLSMAWQTAHLQLF
jgi:hypothetical protein